MVNCFNRIFYNILRWIKIQLLVSEDFSLNYAAHPLCLGFCCVVINQIGSFHSFTSKHSCDVGAAVGETCSFSLDHYGIITFILPKTLFVSYSWKKSHYKHHNSNVTCYLKTRDSWKVTESVHFRCVYSSAFICSTCSINFSVWPVLIIYV